MYIEEYCKLYECKFKKFYSDMKVWKDFQNVLTV